MGAPQQLPAMKSTPGTSKMVGFPWVTLDGLKRDPKISRFIKIPKKNWVVIIMPGYILNNQVFFFIAQLDDEPNLYMWNAWKSPIPSCLPASSYPWPGLIPQNLGHLLSPEKVTFSWVQSRSFNEDPQWRDLNETFRHRDTNSFDRKGCSKTSPLSCWHEPPRCKTHQNTTDMSLGMLHVDF